MTRMGPSDVFAEVEKAGLVAVLVIDRKEDAVPLAEALLAGGVRAMELTLRTPAAVDALRAIRAAVPDMLAGVGTVLTPRQVADVVHAGAAFAVAPGTNPRVISAAREAELPFAPGIATPSDIEQALECGCHLLKFFPAESMGGLEYLKNAAAPYLHLGIRFVPLGGIKQSNLADYARHPLVAAVGGSWLAPRDVIKNRDWAAITASARLASDTIAQARAVRA